MSNITPETAQENQGGVLSEKLEHSIEELANTLTHGVGALLSVAGLVALLIAAIPMADGWRIASFTIFGLSLTALYLASTLYHAERCPIKKDKLKTLDHCAIYFLIAGSYTPFLLVNMRETTGWPLLLVVWGIAFFGIFLKLRFKHRLAFLRVATYLVMGWLVILSGDDLISSLPEGGLFLLALGGLIYTVGVIFYVFDRIPYNHAIWHVFVLAGSACHFFSVYYYVLPLNDLV